MTHYSPSESSRVFACRHWIFDLDGTLTKPVHDFAAIRAELGVPDGIDTLSYFATLPIVDADRRRARLHEIESDLLTITEPADGAIDLLAHLQGRGCRIGLLTRNSRTIARQSLTRIGAAPFFAEDDILGRDEVIPKPAPDGILQLARRWQASLSQCAMVGDYLYDLQAGRAAGAATVHVDSTGDFRWPDLADLRLKTLAELALLLP
ncbi:MAG TPA: HAD family hydrolase [Geobacterales bacterium]|nr:HAD family hydrolase [Geobacterales bacterium]